MNGRPKKPQDSAWTFQKQALAIVRVIDFAGWKGGSSQNEAERAIFRVGKPVSYRP
jgi:hypothetical protein